MAIETGTKLGPYEIRSPIGAGGMGEVYRAQDTRLGREVAVKVLPEELAEDAGARKRFEREAKAVASLSHPNIMALYDVGSEGDTSYAVMELLEGETLRTRVTRSALPWRKAIEIAGAVADGLSAAHAKGVVHRDIKPENIFVTSDGAVKILDFGIARLERKLETGDQGEVSTLPMQTTEGGPIGTPAYMSPEQIEGGHIDARSDVFSLGCVLYEMLSGSRAFGRETAPETMTAILKEDPPDLTTSGAPLPAELDQVIRHCLEKRREERYQSARDLSFMLKSLLTGGAMKADAPRPRWRAAAVGLTAVVVILVGLSAWLIPRLMPGTVETDQRIDSLLVLPFVVESGDADVEFIGEGIAESIINRLVAIGAVRVVPRNTAFRYGGREHELDQVARELGVRAILTGRVTRRGERLIISVTLEDVRRQEQIWGDRFEMPLEDILALEADIADRIATELRLELTVEQRKQLAEGATSNPAAHLAYLEGRFWWHKQTPKGNQRALELFKQAIEADPNFAKAYVGVADAYMGMVNWGWFPPKEASPKVKAAVQEAIELNPSLAEAYCASAQLERTFTWDWEASKRDYLHAIKLNPDYAFAQHSYAHLLALLGRDDEATAKFELAARLEPLSPHHNECLGSHYVLLERYDDAIRVLEQALEWESSFAPAHYYLAWVHERQGNLDKAIEHIDNGVRLSGRIASYVSFLAYCTAVSGDREGAHDLLDELLKRRATETEAVGSMYIGLVHVGLGDLDEAMDWLETAYNERDSTWLPFAQIDAGFDRLRGHPRFTALYDRLELKPRAPIRSAAAPASGPAPPTPVPEP